ncbi:rhamnosyltransferase WsaF family glycosyltransferase [Crystallibacter degradans]|uniref:rhamnosyltransferase WsaF family glycosyltransferase n=1 Tax=Crystallibacter degradans TaxID=2726743 RepID=UPI001472CED7|nr:hypothetical protein [Arthrobacter sp. SF27]NMR28135.1 hypothetical protein [Arthrobacter sp. SF27]
MRLAARETPGALGYSDLHRLSLALTSVETTGGQQPFINVVLPELDPHAIFAGIKTGLEFAQGLAQEMKRPLRIIALDHGPKGAEKDEVIEYLVQEFAWPEEVTVEFASRREVISMQTHIRDYWIATHWTTAHALDVASRLGTLDARRIVYLIQDYEPGFHPWSVEFAIARSTYRAGFHHVVNSSLLAAYLVGAEELRIENEMIFAPSVDLMRLQGAAEARTVKTSFQVLFYARPSKPRNLYDIGVAALRLASGQLSERAIDVTFVSAGEKHDDVQLSEAHSLRSLGKLSWDDYFRVMGCSDVVLSLQHSPHPSHPPLDAVISGARAVTNELGNTRSGIHPRLLVAEPTPEALSNQIISAIDSAVSGETGSFDPHFVSTLGVEMSSTISYLATKLS